MAYTGIFATEAELNSKAGENVDATGWTEANKNQWISEVESYINVLCKKNWSDAYSGLNADVKKLLTEAASNLVAIYGLNYNPNINGVNIQMNVLWTRFNQCIKLLQYQDSESFMEEA